mgnify:FL=1
MSDRQVGHCLIGIDGVELLYTQDISLCFVRVDHLAALDARVSCLVHGAHQTEKWSDTGASSDKTDLGLEHWFFPSDPESCIALIGQSADGSLHQDGITYLFAVKVGTHHTSIGVLLGDGVALDHEIDEAFLIKWGDWGVLARNMLFTLGLRWLEEDHVLGDGQAHDPVGVGELEPQ